MNKYIVFDLGKKVNLRVEIWFISDVFGKYFIIMV